MHDVSPEQLSAWADGDTTGAESELIAAHVHDCAECGEVLAEIEALKSMAAAMKDAPMPDMWPQIAAEVARPSLMDRIRAQFSTPAIALAFAVVIAIILVSRPTPPPPIDAAEQARQEYVLAIERVAASSIPSRTALPEPARKKVEATLAMIDRAIAESQQTLIGGGADGEQLLLALYDEKLRVLEVITHATPEEIP